MKNFEMKRRMEALQQNTQKEMVNHPDHYKDENGKECIDYMIEKFGEEVVIGFCACNAFKYRFRAGKKDGNSKEQDLAKAEWYINKGKELLHNHVLSLENSHLFGYLCENK